MVLRIIICFEKLKGNRGYTLLEVIASLLIMTVLITPLYFQLWQGLRVQQTQDQLLQLDLMAKRHLELVRGEYESNNRLISLQTILSNDEGQEGEVRWKVSWELLDAKNDRGLYQLAVNYYWMDEGKITWQAFLTTLLMGELP